MIAVILAIEMKSLLIGEAVAPELDEKIRVAITDGPEVSKIISLRTLHLGPDDVLVAVKLEFTVRHDARARRRDRHRRSARESLGADREAHLRRARHLPKLAIGGNPVNGYRGNLMADDSAATAAAVDTFNEAFNRHDVDAVMAAMTDDCVFESTSPPFGERHEGQAAVRAGVGELLRLDAHRALRRRGRDHRPAIDASCSGASRGRTTTRPRVRCAAST